MGSLFLILGFTGFVVTGSANCLYIFSVIAGMGWGVMNSLVNTIVSYITSGDTKTMNILHMFFALGAFLSPFAMGIIIRLGFNWRYGIYLIIVLSIIQFFVFLSMPIPLKIDRDGKEGHAKDLSFFSNIQYYIFMLILFFYVGVESIINGWLVTYFSDLNILDEVGAQTVLSIFWIGLIVGRLITSYLHVIYQRRIYFHKWTWGDTYHIIIFSVTWTVCYYHIYVFVGSILLNYISNYSS